jgi:hypothetical protein
MAFGGWFAGALYDRLGFYAPAFAAGALFNLANLAAIGFLLACQAGGARRMAARDRRAGGALHEPMARGARRS